MAKKVVMVVGVVLALVGLLGFFNNPVLGMFPVNALHNIVHLVSGILAIVFAMQDEAQAIMVAKVLGVIYLLVAVLGLITPAFMDSLLVINGADNILHLILAAVLLWAGFGMNRMAASNSSPM